MSLRPIRRVVTGHDARGRSVVLSDEAASNWGESPHLPGLGVTVLYRTDTAMADNEADGRTSQYDFTPGAEGTVLLISQFAPKTEFDALSPERQALVLEPVGGAHAGTFVRDASRDPRMHATHTLDYIIVLSGEMTMLLDEGEVVLRPLDTLVQRGTNHAWINRGDQPVVMAAVVMAAKPLDLPPVEGG